MNAKNIFSILLILFGEALIIFSFLNFGRSIQSEILISNIFVSTIIYCLLFANISFPWLNLKDKSQKQIGSIGLRWFFAFLYSLFSIGLMIYFNSEKSIQYSNQIIIHSIFFFLLLCGLFMAYSSSDKVREVYEEEKLIRGRIDEMKKATKDLQLKLDAQDNVSTEIVTRINELQDNLRYLSPINDSRSIELEKRFLEEINELSISFSEETINMDNIITNIKNCESTFKERKQVFSN